MVRFARPLAVGLFVGATAALVVQIFASEPVDLNDGCGWDGSRYCDMASGKSAEVDEPFSRRFLLPWLARLVSLPVRDSFAVLQFVGLVALCLVTVLWMSPLRDDTKGLRRFYPNTWPMERQVAALLALSCVLAARNLGHLSAWLPANTDLWGLLFLLAGLLSVMLSARSPIALAIAVVTVFLAPSIRESSSVVLAVAAVVSVFLFALSWRRAVLLIFSSGLGLALALWVGHRPTSEERPAVVDLVITYARWAWLNVSTPGEMSRFLVMICLGIGPLGILLCIGKFRRALEPEETYLLLVALVTFIVSVFAGGDSDRILMPIGILISIAVLRVSARRREFLVAAALLVTGFVVSQSPFTVLSPDPSVVLGFFGLRYATWWEFYNYGVAPLMMAGIFVVAAIISLRGTDARSSASPEGRSPGDVT